MDQFGVTKPSLKALAKTPQIPVVDVTIKPEPALQQSKTVTWLGVVLNEPSGDEMSAFGVAFDAGGVSLTAVADNAEAAKLGFRTGDLLLEINGVSVRKLTDLKEYLLKQALVKKHNVQLIRSQAKMGMTVTANLPFITP